MKNIPVYTSPPGQAASRSVVLKSLTLSDGEHPRHATAGPVSTPMGGGPRQGFLIPLAATQHRPGLPLPSGGESTGRVA